jgi:hypothetical protein
MSVTNNNVAFELTLTGSAQQLPAHLLFNGGTLTAKSTNTGNVGVGLTSSVTASNSYILEKGVSLPIQASNTNQLWINGTASDVISFFGN